MYKKGVRDLATQAQKQASAKYHKENISSLACRVRKEQAEQFKEYCDQQGRTVNAVLKDFVMDCIESNKKTNVTSGD